MSESSGSGQASDSRLRRALLPTVLSIVLVAAAFGITAQRASSLGMDEQPPMWVINAIPAVLTELHYGISDRYVVLPSVRDRYFESLPDGNVSAKAVNLSMRKAREINPARVSSRYEALGPNDKSYVLMGPDDKGIVDLIELSFLTLGYAVENVTIMYFVILLASCVLYVIAFWRSSSLLLLLCALLAMLYLVMPMVIYHGQLRSLLALRTMPVLAMVACLHCLVFMVSSLRGRPAPWQYILVGLQVALITFTIHLRATTIWQVITVIGFGVCVLIAARFRPFGLPRAQGWATGAAVGVTVGLIVTGYVGLRVYQHYGLPERYRIGEEIATRVFWHNIFSGLAYHPAFAERYGLGIDDASIFAATRDYLAEIGRPDRWHDMGGDNPDFSGLKFARYDPVVREMLVARCTTYARECASALLYYKPVALAGNLAWLYGWRNLPPHLEITDSRMNGDAQVRSQTIHATELMDQNGQRAYLWTSIVLLLILPFGLLLTRESRGAIWTAFAALVGLLTGSLIPTVIGYPIAHTIVEAALTFGMLGYFGLCAGIMAVVPALAARGLARQPRAEASPALPTAAR